MGLITQLQTLFFLTLQVFVLQATAQLPDSSSVTANNLPSTIKSNVNVPFLKNGDYHTFGLKARILPWTIGNMGGLNASLGIEQSFFKTHSFTLEGYYYGFQDHHDNYHGPNNPNNSESDHHYKLNLALVGEYRFYSTSIQNDFSSHVYFGLTSRFGKMKETWDIASKDEPTYQFRHYTSAGPLVGLVIKPRWRKRLGIDVNAGIRYTNSWVGSVYPLQPDQVNTWSQLTSFNLHLSLYLAWYFFE